MKAKAPVQAQAPYTHTPIQALQAITYKPLAMSFKVGRSVSDLVSSRLVSFRSVAVIVSSDSYRLKHGNHLSAPVTSSRQP